MSPTCRSIAMFSFALSCMPLGMALTGTERIGASIGADEEIQEKGLTQPSKPGEGIGETIDADGQIQPAPNGDESSPSLVDGFLRTTPQDGDPVNIRFGGEATEGTQGDTTHFLLRPGSVKSLACDKEVCHGCTDDATCWHGKQGGGKYKKTGSVGKGKGYGQLVLDKAQRERTSYAVEVYLRCPAGGQTSIWLKKFSGGKVEIYTDQETPGQMKSVFGPSTKDNKKITIKETENQDTRIRVVFYPDDASIESEASILITAEDVDPHVDGCMTGKECLKVLSNGEDTEAGADLRNDNKWQLDCLEGRTMQTEKLQTKCGLWDNCVSKSDTHKNNLVAFLRAGVGGHVGSLNQEAVAANDTAAATDPNQCVDPAADDAESWDCECLDDMVSGCESSDSPLEECLRARMCNFDAVCGHWKKDNNCPNAMIQKKSTDASARLMRRQISTKSNAHSAIDSELDGTMQGKCAV